MGKMLKFESASMLAMLATMGAALPAAAATRGVDPAPAELEEVVVTGTFLSGSPKNGALPVDVVGASELAERGAPTVVDLVKTITAAQSSIGEANRFNGGAASGTINLRGFGSSRTLVLMNGRRLADTTEVDSRGLTALQGGGQDINFIPQAAIGRIEILKDGAAATYGSDAVAGVVNFITRRDLQGVEIRANYASIRKSDGDYDVSVAMGRQFDHGNLLLTAEYSHRSPLAINDRGFAVHPFESIYYGGWSGFSNPTSYMPPDGSFRTLFIDNGCNQLGGQLTTPFAVPTAGAGASKCRFQITRFSDLVSDESHYRLYAEANFELSDRLSFHAEAAATKSEVPQLRIVPSTPTTQFPTPASIGGASGSTAPPGFNLQSLYFVPANNPGLVALRMSCAAPLTADQCASTVNGVTINPLAWRPIAAAGHPTNPDGADFQKVEVDQFRVSAGLKGDLGHSVSFDSAVTFMEERGRVVTNDLLVNRIQNALNGLGGPGCNPATGTPGRAACSYFNPFSNAVATSAVNGAANPYFQASVANNPELVKWMYGTITDRGTNRLFVGDLVFTGRSGIHLKGGEITWAAGGQYRYDQSLFDANGFGNVREYPCVDSIGDGIPACPSPVGPFALLGALQDINVDRSVVAAFGEVRIPILETLELTGALRHEQFSGGLPSTTNPKVAAKWDVTPWLAVRGSASSTFRAPSARITAPGIGRDASNLGGSYLGVATENNPNLRPETAKTFNAGVLLHNAHFNASLDYYRFDFKDELGVEDAAAIFAALGDTGAGCANPALTARFVFTSGGCGQANVLQVTRRYVNGPRTRTSGLDFRAEYAFDDFFGRDLMGIQATVGVDATYLIEYKRGVSVLPEDPSVILSEAANRAGLHDLGGADYYSYPKTRANAFVNLQGTGWNLRWQMLYREGTRNVGPSCSGDNDAFSTADCRFNYASGHYQSVGKSHDYFQHDVVFAYDTPWDATVSLSVLNVFDRDPPFVQSFSNYDLTNGNPLGRVIKAGVRVKF